MALSSFRIYSPAQFNQYILNTNFSRPVKFIQNHHTWRPSYQDITPQRDEMYWLESMRNDHIKARGWKDIGQNITTFSSGNIGLCRPINLTPAGIKGANTGAICIEHFGNFDTGHDVMPPPHIDTIVTVNAILCIKFGLKPQPSDIVYHHWFDTGGTRFSDLKINSGQVLNSKQQKTCPGTNFFHNPADPFAGNTISSAIANFYPLIEAKIAALRGIPPVAINAVRKTVTADSLNVRSAPTVKGPVLRQLKKDTMVNIYETASGWSKISVSAEEWVNDNYLI